MLLPLKTQIMLTVCILIDEAENGMSFRNYEDLLLIGGGGHRTGKQGRQLGERLKNFRKILS